MSEHSELPDVPPVRLPGSETYWDGYEWGEALAARFPHQDPINFGCAIAFNRPADGPAADAEITELVLLRQGENDDRDWLWYVVAGGEPFVLRGWCDYTGWDCQSSAEWYALGGAL